MTGPCLRLKETGYLGQVQLVATRQLFLSRQDHPGAPSSQEHRPSRQLHQNLILQFSPTESFILWICLVRSLILQVCLTRNIILQTYSRVNTAPSASSSKTACFTEDVSCLAASLCCECPSACQLHCGHRPACQLHCKHHWAFQLLWAPSNMPALSKILLYLPDSPLFLDSVIILPPSKKVTSFPVPHPTPLFLHSGQCLSRDMGSVIARLPCTAHLYVF